jgi:hypothetical protein
MTDTVESYPIINIPFLYKYGLYIQNSTSINGTLNPETKLSVLAGVCRDSNDITDIRFGDNNPSLNGAITSAPVRIDNTITGSGGLDEGIVEANTMYAIYIISDSRGYLPISAVATFILNIYAAGPLMPAGYDTKRLIGFWATGSDTLWLTGYYSYYNSPINTLFFTYDTPQATAVTSGSSNTYAYVDLSNFVPLIHNTPVSISTIFRAGAAGDTLTLASGLSTNPNGQLIITGQVSGVNVTSNSTILAQNAVVSGPLPSPAIQYKVSGTDTVAIYVAGFSVSI